MMNEENFKEYINKIKEILKKKNESNFSLFYGSNLFPKVDIWTAFCKIYLTQIQSNKKIAGDMKRSCTELKKEINEFCKAETKTQRDSFLEEMRLTLDHLNSQFEYLELHFEEREKGEEIEIGIQEIKERGKTIEETLQKFIKKISKGER